MTVSKTKVSPIRAVMGFNALTDANLVVLANGVLKGLTGNASFPNPTLSLTTFGNDITAYSSAITAALDGGKNAKSAREKAKKVVVKNLRQLAMYVESDCNDAQRGRSRPRRGRWRSPRSSRSTTARIRDKSWRGSSRCREPRRKTCATVRCRPRRRLRRARPRVRRPLRLKRRQAQPPGRRRPHGRC